MRENRLLHCLRLGTHADKEIIIQCQKSFDVLVLNANLVEYTSKATSSLIYGPLKKTPYVIDPGTHAFGHDPRYIMSRGVEVHPDNVKKSVQLLAERYGSPVVDVLGQRAVSPGDFGNKAIQEKFANHVIDFQLNVLEEEISEDAKYLDARIEARKPLFIIAPYFYVPFEDYGGWLSLNLELLRVSPRIHDNMELYSEIVLENRFLDYPGVLKEVADRYLESDACDGYLLWISNFPEHEATLDRLTNLCRFVKELSSSGRPVINMFAGYFSTVLHHVGLSGICHGPGYGEDRDVVPVGGGIPAPKYYFTPVHQRIPSREVELLVRKGIWSSVEMFHQEVCSQNVCRTVLNGDLSNFYLFGETELRIDKNGDPFDLMTSKTKSRLTAHFFEAKEAEIENVSIHSISELIVQLNQAYKKYEPPMQEKLGYLNIWADALDKYFS